MYKEIRFGWLGESRRAALHSLLAALVDDWVRHWWMGPADVVVEVQVDEGKQDKRAMPWVCAGDAGTLAIYAAGKEFDAIGRLLAGANVTTDADADLVHRLGEEALLDLASRVQLRAGTGKPVKPWKEQPPLSVEHAFLGAVRVAAKIGRLSLELAIDPQLADRLAPPVAVAKAPVLVQRQVAIQQAPLKVTAVMDFGSVNLAHLSDLSIGEVLVGDRRLDEPLQIHLQGHGAIAAGFLRRSGEQRAVVLDEQP